jgi:hypothetical protein
MQSLINLKLAEIGCKNFPFKLQYVKTVMISKKNKKLKVILFNFDIMMTGRNTIIT